MSFSKESIRKSVAGHGAKAIEEQASGLMKISQFLQKFGIASILITPITAWLHSKPVNVYDLLRIDWLYPVVLMVLIFFVLFYAERLEKRCMFLFDIAEEIKLIPQN